MLDSVVRQEIPGGTAPDTVVRQQIPGGLAPDTVIRGGNRASNDPDSFVFLRGSRRHGGHGNAVSPSRPHGNRPTPRPLSVRRNGDRISRPGSHWDWNWNRGDRHYDRHDRHHYFDRCNYWYYRGYRPSVYHYYDYYPDYYDTCSSFAFGFSVYDTYGAYYPVYPVYTPVYYPQTYATYPQAQYYPEGTYYPQGEYQQQAQPAQPYPAPQQGLPAPQSEGETVEPLPEGVPPETAPSMDLPDASDIRVPDEHVQQLMQQGLADFEKGEYENAARTFLQAAMSDPDNVDALLAYAVARFATGDYDVSAIAIRRGLRKFPGVVNAAFDIRGRYTDLNDFERHLIALGDFLQRHPESVDGWIVLGFVRHFSDQRELSKRTFELVKRLSPEDRELADTFIAAEDLPQIPEELLEEPSETDELSAPREPGEPSLEEVDPSLGEAQELEELGAEPEAAQE